MKFAVTSSTTSIQPRSLPESPQVSIDVVGPLLELIARKHGITTSELAARSGVCPRRMNHIVTHIGRLTKYDVPHVTSMRFVDQVLTRSGEQDLWHEPPLRDLFLRGSSAA